MSCDPSVRRHKGYIAGDMVDRVRPRARRGKKNERGRSQCARRFPWLPHLWPYISDRNGVMTDGGGHFGQSSMQRRWAQYRHFEERSARGRPY